MGAWTQIYKRGMKSDSGPLHLALLAIKRELAYRGYNSPPMDLDTGYIGGAADHNIRDFQSAYNLIRDGEVGPLTARRLFLRRANEVQQNLNIPSSWVAKVVGAESAWDPGAVGELDPADHGLAQINLDAHPDISMVKAFDPQFALYYLGHGLANAYAAMKDWEAAVVSWNVGLVGATYWLENGKPSTLRVAWFQGDLGARASVYFASVQGQVVT